MCRRRERQEEAPLGCRYYVEPRAAVPTENRSPNPYMAMYSRASRHAEIRRECLAAYPEAVFDRTLDRRIDNYLSNRNSRNGGNGYPSYGEENPAPSYGGGTGEKVYVKRTPAFFFIIIFALIMLTVILMPHILPNNDGVRQSLSPYKVAYMAKYEFTRSADESENAEVSYNGKSYRISSAKAYSAVFVDGSGRVLQAEDSNHRIYGSEEVTLDKSSLRYVFNGDGEFPEQFIIDTEGDRVFTPETYYPSVIDMFAGMISGFSQKEEALPSDNLGTLFHTAINGAAADEETAETASVAPAVAGYVIPISFLLLAVFAVYLIMKAFLGLATGGRRRWFFVAVLIGIIVLTVIFGVVILGEAVNCKETLDIAGWTSLGRSGWTAVVLCVIITFATLITIPFLYKGIAGFEEFNLKVKYTDGEFPFRRVVANKIKVRKEYEYENENENTAANEVEYGGYSGRNEVAVPNNCVLSGCPVPIECPLSDTRRF